MLVTVATEVVAKRGVLERAVSVAKMWRWVVCFQAASALLAGATLDLRFLSRLQLLPSNQASCHSGAHRNSIHGAWRSKRSAFSGISPTFPTFSFLNANEIMSRRFDRLLPNAEDIVKEHAKLVQDINSLRQVAFIKPLGEDKDYEESVFHDVIEVSTTSRPTPKPTTSRPPPPPQRPSKSSSIPIILLGGASHQDIVRTQPMKFSKPISLVGTSVSPLVKHPYPFVMQGTPKPIKICMNPMHMNMLYSTTTARPSLLQRLLNSILPRGR